MIRLDRNNLDQSASPYLRQHADNPVNWQEWSPGLVDEAIRLGRPLFVSVGYATCHWCHVMAARAFSDPETARLLNESYICVKIDRELRPDIDHFLMQYLVARAGQGGWPLNAFLTPALTPVYALTYAEPITLASIARQVRAFLDRQAGALPAFVPLPDEPAPATGSSLVEDLLAWQDRKHGGFGPGAKFPPHTALLFLLHFQAAEPSEAVRAACARTLDAMQQRGLNDHLQGGIFRYCVDPAWSIPHFEKMLYDQAMALWTYALAARVLGGEAYQSMTLEILRCLDESFAGDPFFVTAHDADTGHLEGAVYLWSWEELQRDLTPAEFERFTAEYEISPEGNFEGRNHLIRRRHRLNGEGAVNPLAVTDNPAVTGHAEMKSGRPDAPALAAIEAKLLALRRLRPQPLCDDKVLCDLNALTAVALVQAGRQLGRLDLEARARNLVRHLLATFRVDGQVRHARAGGRLLDESFLADAAALLLAVTMLAEADPAWLVEASALEPIVRTFRRDGTWYESLGADFPPVAAAWFDHPIPSSISLAELALARCAWQNGGDPDLLAYRAPYQADFYNLAAMLTQGGFHQVTSPLPLPWTDLPPNTIQRRGEPATDCHAGVCSPLAADQRR